MASVCAGSGPIRTFIGPGRSREKPNRLVRHGICLHTTVAVTPCCCHIWGGGYSVPEPPYELKRLLAAAGKVIVGVCQLWKLES